jgi:integrase
MAWPEKHRNTYLVREWVNGKKVTLASFTNSADAEAEARWYSKTGKLRPITSGELIQRLEQSAGFRKKKASPKFAAYAYNLIESDPNIQETSRSAYMATIRNHVEGSILDVPLSSIVEEPALVRKFWVNLMPMKDYAASGSGMKASVHRLLTKVFTQAVRDDVIPTNPMSKASIKRPSKKAAVPREPLTIDEVEELAAACLNERDRLIILVGGYCGLRGGEVGGLRLKDIDTKACRFSIMQAVKGRGSNKHLGLPKGDKTRRITVPCSVSEAVASFAKENAATDGRIFHTDGGLIGSRRTTLVSQAAAKRSGFRPVNFHLLRHTTASLLVDDGASIKDVQDYLGIATAAILLDTYSHAFEGRDQQVANRLEARRADWRERMKKRAV